MRINLREIIEIPGGVVPFACNLEENDLVFPSVTGYRELPSATGKIFNEAGILRMQGTIKADMFCLCDRCGAEFESTKEQSFDLLLGDNPEDDAEIFPLDGNEVDVSEVLTTCFILDMETKFLCKEDCKGLCMTCGKNLNDGPCGCKKALDPRFAVLEQLLDK